MLKNNMILQKILVVQNIDCIVFSRSVSNDSHCKVLSLIAEINLTKCFAKIEKHLFTPQGKKIY